MRFTILATALLLTGCMTEETPSSYTPASYTAATQQQFAVAKSAASTCAQHAPNWTTVEAALLQKGYIATPDARLKSIQSKQRATILEKPQSGVVVLIGTKSKEGACIIGLKGMTPEQSYELALPWVEQYGAVSNSERGQNLSKRAVQAWAARVDNRQIYIAAYKTWDVLDVPGAAARLLMYTPG